MFNRFFGPKEDKDLPLAERPAPVVADPHGDTATVRRIVAKLEAMPPEQARLVASAAYTLARAANADLDISDQEMGAIETELQAHEGLDEATAVLVAEMAKLQAKTVGGTEDYVVTREFKSVSTRGTAARGPARVLRDQRGQRHDLGRGERGPERDRARSSTSRMPTSTSSGPTTTTSSRRCRRSAGSRRPAEA